MARKVKSYKECCNFHSSNAPLIASKIDDENELEAFAWLSENYPNYIRVMLTAKYNPFVHLDKIINYVGFKNFVDILVKSGAHRDATSTLEYLVSNYTDEIYGYLNDNSENSKTLLEEDLRRRHHIFINNSLIKEPLQLIIKADLSLSMLDPKTVFNTLGPEQTMKMLNNRIFESLPESWKTLIFKNPEYMKYLSGPSLLSKLVRDYSTRHPKDKHSGLFLEPKPSEWIIKNFEFLKQNGLDLSLVGNPENFIQEHGVLRTSEILLDHNLSTLPTKWKVAIVEYIDLKDIFEHFAKDDVIVGLIKGLPFKKIVNNDAFMKILKENLKEDFLHFLLKKYNASTKEEIVECLKKIDLKYILDDLSFMEWLRDKYDGIFDLLPYNLIAERKIKEVFSRNKKLYTNEGFDDTGYDINWVNADGKLIRFFTLLNEFPINSKEDYLKIYEEYLASNLSVHDFCKKFRISSEAGFERMIRRLKNEDIKKCEDLLEMRSRVGQKYFQYSLESFNEICEDKMSVQEFFENSRTIGLNLKRFLTIGNREQSRFVVKKFIDFYQSKGPFLTFKEYNFILVKDENGKLSARIMEIARPYLNSPEDNAYYAICKKIDANLAGLSMPLSRKKLLNMVITKNGKTLKVDENSIDQAVLYAKQNDLVVCQSLILELLRKICTGEIDYLQETEKYKEDMKEAITSILNEKQTIEEYLDTLNLYNDENSNDAE